MPDTKDLDEALLKASELLVDCCTLISDIPFESDEKNVYRLGKAIAEVNDVRSDLYAKHPRLRPEVWGEAPTEVQYQEGMNNALELAEENLQNGEPKEALRVYESFISIGPPSNMVRSVQARIKEVRSEYGI